MVFVARDLRMRGYRTATAGYRRLGRFGGGGGFPETFDDVKSALEVTVGAPGVDREQLVVVGHSAGGHLALWLATERPALCRGAVSIAGLADLEPSWDRNVASVVALIEKAPAADRFEATSPLHRVPSGLPTACVHSTSDETVDHAVSRRFVDASTAAGDPADLTLVDDESHRAGLWPASATWQAAVERLEHIFASSQG